jgi:hypothetical protein
MKRRAVELAAGDRTPCHVISAVTGAGLGELIRDVAQTLERAAGGSGS